MRMQLQHSLSIHIGNVRANNVIQRALILCAKTFTVGDLIFDTDQFLTSQILLKFLQPGQLLRLVRYIMKVTSTTNQQIASRSSMI